MTPQLVFTTCADQESAETLATYLVEQGLAACVNIIPGIRSIYRWEGEIVRDSEYQLLIKSTAECFAALREAIIARHPYELPEVIAVSITAGHPPYLAWIDSQLEKQQ